MSNITIAVEFLAGTSIEDAIQEAKMKAIFWSVAYVKFSFNGVKISVKQNTDVEKTVKKYMDLETFKDAYIIG